jgi:hypothetical protein
MQIETINLNLPESRIGKFTIKKKLLRKGTYCDIINKREALYTGQKSKSKILEKDLIIDVLSETDYGTWMTTSPQEIRQMREDIKNISGKVLIGGLGLGVVAKLLDEKPEVTDILIVEQSQEIIDLVFDNLNLKKASVTKYDLFSYLERIPLSFDYGYYDIWCPTGEDVLFTHIRPLRKLSKKRIKKEVICWQEKTMIGQMIFNIFSTLEVSDEKSGWKILNDEQFKRSYNFSRTTWPFQNWYRTIKPDIEFAKIMAKNYVNTYVDIDEWNNQWKKWDYETKN